MFSLMSGIVKWLFAKPAMRILVLGIDNAGKTTTLEWIKASQGQKSLNTAQIVPTVGLNLARIEMNGVIAYFWDVGGQAALRTLWTRFYDECQTILYVIDISDTTERFNESIRVLNNDVLHNPIFQTRTDPLPVVVLLNKIDTLIEDDQTTYSSINTTTVLNQVQRFKSTVDITTSSSVIDEQHQPPYIAAILLGSAIQMNSTHGQTLISTLIRLGSKSKQSKSDVTQIQTLWTQEQPSPIPISCHHRQSSILLRSPPPFLPLLIPAGPPDTTTTTEYYNGIISPSQ